MNPFAKIVRVVLGVILILIGLIGGLIPIFQGWIFGLPGLMLLGSVFPSIKRLTHRVASKAKKSLEGNFLLRAFKKEYQPHLLNQLSVSTIKVALL